MHAPPDREQQPRWRHRIEPFSGSGTTIIGAETTGRTCLAVEIEGPTSTWRCVAGRRSPEPRRSSKATATALSGIATRARRGLGSAASGPGAAEGLSTSRRRSRRPPRARGLDGLERATTVALLRRRQGPQEARNARRIYGTSAGYGDVTPPNSEPLCRWARWLRCDMGEANRRGGDEGGGSRGA